MFGKLGIEITFLFLFYTAITAVIGEDIDIYSIIRTWIIHV